MNEDMNLGNRAEIKNRKLHVEHKKVKDKVLRKHKPRDFDRESILKNARAKAHSIIADTKRELSNEMRKNTNITESFNIFEKFDFIEESLGTGEALHFQVYEEPIENKSISEALSVDHSYYDPKYLTIGSAEGCFAPIGVLSRNGRVYDEDHYTYLLSNENLRHKILTRAMLGTIGHHDKRVDDEDLANGVCSHVVTVLEVREDQMGTPYLYGKLEILNTEAGRRLRQLYEHGIPLYVSSRGGGRLLDVPGQNYKRVDKENYFLETFDVVKEPGFLQAKPVPSVGLNESDLDENNGENAMKKADLKKSKINESLIPEDCNKEDEKEAKEREDEKELKEGCHKKGKIKEDNAEKEDDKKAEDDKKEDEKIEEAEEKPDCEKEHKVEDGLKEDDETEDDKDEEIVDEAEEDDKKEEKAEDDKKEDEKIDEEDGRKEDDKEEENGEAEEVKELIDYKAKYESLEPVIEELLSMIRENSKNLNKLLEEREQDRATIASLTERINEAKANEDDEEDKEADAEDDKEDIQEADAEDDKKEKEDDKEEKSDAEKLGEALSESLSNETLAVGNAKEVEVFSAFAKQTIQPSNFFSVFRNK